MGIDGLLVLVNGFVYWNYIPPNNQMKTKEEVIAETERLKGLASNCQDNEIRLNLVCQINTLLWVHNKHYD